MSALISDLHNGSAEELGWKMSGLRTEHCYFLALTRDLLMSSFNSEVTNLDHHQNPLDQLGEFVFNMVAIQVEWNIESSGEPYTGPEAAKTIHTLEAHTQF